MRVDFVVDSSIVLSWLIEDERTQLTDNLLELLVVHGQACIAPHLQRFEVSNAMLMALKRGRLTKEKMRESLGFYNILPIFLDEDSSRLAVSSVVSIAEKHNLSIYDASYLDLSVRLDLPLATNDKALKLAAKKEKVRVL